MSFDTWENELYHHGIKGQRWGIRRFQNEDGSLTAEGLARYGEGGTATAKERARFLNALDRQRAHAEVKSIEKQNHNRHEKAGQYEKTQQVTKKTIDQVKKAASKDKINISEKQIMREVTTGRTVAKSIALSVGISALVSAGSIISAGAAAAKMALASPLGIGHATAGLYAIPAVFTKRTKGTKYKA